MSSLLFIAAAQTAEFQDVLICGWQPKADWVLAYWSGIVWIVATLLLRRRRANLHGTLLTSLGIHQGAAFR